jgi:hypothetical protein
MKRAGAGDSCFGGSEKRVGIEKISGFNLR